MQCEYCGRLGVNKGSCDGCGAPPLLNFQKATNKITAKQEEFIKQYGTLPSVYFPVATKLNSLIARQDQHTALMALHMQKYNAARLSMQEITGILEV